MRVIVGKSKVMKVVRNVNNANMGMVVSLGGDRLEEVECFKYLGSNVDRSGGVEVEVCQRVNEGCKVLGACKRVFKSRSLHLNAKKTLNEGVIVPTVLYGAEAWGLREAERRRLNVFEMKCLRSMIGVTRMDRRG